MRNAFAEEITALAATDPGVVLLSGDIGNRLFDRFKETAPERFFNCGVAEANMMSVAAGMALSGLRPVVYTITPFVTTRCLEQIRVDVCYHKAPVTIVGVGSGLGYASLGPTHQSMEDIAFLRPLPNISIVCPGDPWEARAALRAALQVDAAVYIRLGKKGEPPIHAASPVFQLGRSIRMAQGRDLCILSTGLMTRYAMEAAERLRLTSLSAAVVHIHTIKPLDEALLAEIFAAYPLVATLEEHGLFGGMGSAVAEWASDQGKPGARLIRFATADHYLHEAGGRSHVLRHHGMQPDQISNRLRSAIQEIRIDAA